MSDQKSEFTGVLSGKTVVVGISGSIAAYKSADLVSELRRAGAEVFVVMTEAATRFISSLTMGTLSRNPVLTSMWQDERGWQPGHIELADRADMLLVAPATANQIGNFANGCAPDALSSIYLATEATIIMVPAMNGKMYLHPATQGNLVKLRQLGVRIVEPEEGELACGYEGTGKMATVPAILKEVLACLGIAP
jgi:phosphopantothenoylcysteine synthetase/decarboxylase